MGRAQKVTALSAQLYLKPTPVNPLQGGDGVSSGQGGKSQEAILNFSITTVNIRYQDKQAMTEM